MAEAPKDWLEATRGVVEAEGTKGGALAFNEAILDDSGVLNVTCEGEVVMMVLRKELHKK